MAKVVVAGGTGELGSRICKYLIANGANVHVLTRTAPDQKMAGVIYHKLDYTHAKSLAKVCKEASCVVSALSGVRDVIVDIQTTLLNVAVEAGVPRFIPSDYCIDYRPLPHGGNRNLDLRREFSTIVDSSGIKATSILNGMFTDLLRDEAPVILKKQKRIFFWGDADQKMDFTSIDNTAEVTALTALDDTSPRWVRIAGEEASMIDLRMIASHVFGEKFKMLRPGGLKAFNIVINVTRTIVPGRKEPFPAWQGMQYLHDMLTGKPKHSDTDNHRYKSVKWDSIASIIEV